MNAERSPAEERAFDAGFMAGRIHQIGWTVFCFVCGCIATLVAVFLCR